MQVSEVKELAAYRLDRKLTFAELSEQMLTAGCDVPRSTLAAVLNGTQRPFETTLHHIRRFVEHERAAGRLPLESVR